MIKLKKISVKIWQKLIYSLDPFFSRFKLLIMGTQGAKTGVAVWWLNMFMPVFRDLSPLVEEGILKSQFDLHQSRTKSKNILENLPLVSHARNNSGLNLANFLHTYVSNFSPKTIVETGVANGGTTLCVQDAIKNSATKFISFDINPKCAEVNKKSDNWNFYLLKIRKKHTLKKVVNSLPGIDLWIHDSDHRYRWQKFEYKLALKKLKPGAFLVSDDVDSSLAWSELSQSKEMKYMCAVYDDRKFIGIFQKK